jgi:hypothetical protein
MTLDTVLRLVTLGIFFSMIPFCIFSGILSLFGFSTLMWNDQPLTGLSGLIASPFIGLFMSMIFTVFIAPPISFGLWLFSKITPLSISYIAMESKE